MGGAEEMGCLFTLCINQASIPCVQRSALDEEEDSDVHFLQSKPTLLPSCPLPGPMFSQLLIPVLIHLSFLLTVFSSLTDCTIPCRFAIVS